MPPIQLKVTVQQTETGLPCQLLSIQLTTGIIEPQDLQKFTVPPDLESERGIIIEGRAPIWLYGFLIHQCHATPWVACYDPRLGGAVVVESHRKGVAVGDVIKITL